TRRTFSLTLEAGTSTRSCPARIPLRKRFNKSVMGSPVTMLPFTSAPPLPGCLQHAGQISGRGVLPKANATKPKLAQDAPRAAARAAPTHLARHEFRLPLRLDDHCPSCHVFDSL